ncbi:3-hydroxyacyl-CoA dehydrogenase [Rhodovastum atsumiense]|uniref:3-hydroxyacyl-CoA dehydrogenase n=1 Tax=Rhodovastum atsumiense TaxID=504468 RepID=A0A5M6J0P8_9PROT|nr:3-hydroxyacyl-CoA dehydrogenase [Rhodovastum atsumiense]KAA5614081.1 3-hydroxyacyl-CoA dehydrogenase [Rhodovastum atsumiense]CAH2598901.1 3-hydroxyacyl-CoA dehydrogenase [Rhodovastum atsumiense]
MVFDPDRPALAVGIVGTGVMGRGIAQVAAAAGCTVLLLDACPGAAQAAKEQVGAMLFRLAEKGRVTEAVARAALDAIRVAATPADLANCELIIEAIREDLEAKRALVAELDAVLGEDCVIATNTSSLSVTAIATGSRWPERVAGFHFFNPVPLMKVVEVVQGLRTAPAVLDALVGFAGRIGHAPIRTRDTPGFVVNHAGRAFGTEALQILREGIADVATIDRILCDAAGFRMGPFELFDLTGLDVSQPVMESLYEQYYQEPRYRPSPIARQRRVAGLLGRKTGCGFYAYDHDRRVVPVEPPVPTARAGGVWIAPGPAHGVLVNLVSRLGATVLFGAPSADAVCLVAPLGEDATTAALAHGLDASRTIAIDVLPGLDRRRTLMTTPLTTAAVRDAAHGLFAADGVPVSIISDSAGFVVQRVLAGIVNLGCDIAQQRIALPADIDRAVMLGLGYPLGPLAWGDRLGPSRVLGILEAMLGATGDPRYRPSPWLRRRARLGVSLLTPEAGPERSLP